MYGSVCWVPSPIYPPLQAAAHWARCFVLAPCIGHTQLLKKGPRSRASVSAGLRSGGTVTQKGNVSHPIGAVPRWFGNRGHDRLDARDFCCAVSRQLRIMVMIASGPVSFAAQ
jgi:hypothetical protein